jgi:hypothetical protein
MTESSCFCGGRVRKWSVGEKERNMNSTTRSTLWRFVWFLVLGLSCVCQGQVIYVDAAATGANNGSSWQDACKHLQDALAAAKSAARPVEIRVAQGTYKPDQGVGIIPGDQTATFQLLNGVTLKGGYAGTAAANPDVRDVGLYETILNGDLADNGSSDFQSGQDDSCHVVTGSLTDSTAVIDGFAVTGGNWMTFRCGMGTESAAPVLIDAGSPTIRDCHFVATSGHEGAVFLGDGSAPTLIDCAFSDNETGVRSVESRPTFLNCLFAGNKWEAMSCSGSGAPSLTNCRFESNGTGVDAHGNVTLADCTFVDNSRAVEGWPETVSAANCVFERNGRAIDLSSGTLRLTGCRFDENRSGAVSGSAATSATRCSFTRNSGSFAGGIEAFGNVSASDCTFTANTGRGAGAISGAHVLTLRNCEFNGNIGRVGAVDMGGTMFRAAGCLFTGNSGQPTGALSSGAEVFFLSNCTFADNRGSVNAIRHDKRGPACPAEMTQCIIRDGPAAVLEESSDTAGPIVLTYSNVQGGYAGEGNIDVDPCFIAPGYWADPNDLAREVGPEDPCAVWVPGDYHLKSQAGHWDRQAAEWVQDEVTSVCIDAGDPNGAIGVEPFPNGGIVNLGAYGGTAEASLSYFGGPVCRKQIPGDINGDCVVNDTDMAILTSHWLLQGWPTDNLPPAVTIAQPKDGDEFHGTEPLSVRADASDPDGVVIRVAFHMEYRGAVMSYGHGDIDADPLDGWGCEWKWPDRGAFEPHETWTIWAEAMDNEGTITVSPRIKVMRHVTN